jgi:crotonobetainyl-CoA:carnitine CoA-transferase CaiB-like acyl-CoA transferase
VGVPCAAVNTLREAVAIEQFAASKMLSEPLGDERPMRLITVPLSFDGVRSYPRGIAPALGADNAEIAETAS